MLSNKITFSDFDISEGKISFVYKEEGEKHTKNSIVFELAPSIIPRKDLIAISLSTLCAKKYDAIHFDLKMSNRALSAISNFTDATVTSLDTFDILIDQKKGGNVTLNFSGGFDSLAAKCLMPDNTKLVSMDYGGRFSREKTFFEKFDTCIVSTNLLETPLRYNSWSMMGIASILFSDYLGTTYQTFGSILEAGPNNFSDNPVAAKNISFPPFAAAGMENAPYVLGLTEIGTLRVLSHFSPELISGSLDSLASPGEEKRYRKQVLTLIESEKSKKDFKLNLVDKPSKPHFKFGQSFAVDFLSLYVIKNTGLDTASHTLSDIPDEAVQLANKLTLDFYERVNPKFLVNFPKPLLPNYLSKLGQVGILPYTDNDWKEFNEVRSFLSKNYTI
ncbi:hypothetical protein KM915_16880 [Cytobacillus oceanisediminis]|uniref:hypothetical protein n=1 Tax=Cytobacillus oceanisediminis TaxID=665099 RepID=UPI001C211092|nr:hypothetical protein [Cytobacillus oceanisediminis]MBU8731729.1 hypothetical protein [Cytobacillus oceanisediminis]